MKKLYVLLLLIISFKGYSQDLLNELESDKTDSDKTIATFKGPRLINGHSVKTNAGRSLDFIFSHRFGAINSGWYEMFGLDQSLVRIGLDYGINDRLTVGVGRISYDKTFELYGKYQFFQQQSGKKNVPITITGVGTIAYKLSPEKNSDVSPTFQTTDRMAYVGQLLIARKFSSAFSMQLMPTLVHKNYVVNALMEANDQVLLGVGGRLKLTPSVALTSEYYYNASTKDNAPMKNAFGVGFDIETGGHIFQLVFTNAFGLSERAFLTETTQNFFDGDIHFGFNITRTFQF